MGRICCTHKEIGNEKTFGKLVEGGYLGD